MHKHKQSNSSIKPQKKKKKSKKQQQAIVDTQNYVHFTFINTIIK